MKIDWKRVWDKFENWQIKNGFPRKTFSRRIYIYIYIKLVEVQLKPKKKSKVGK